MNISEVETAAPPLRVVVIEDSISFAKLVIAQLESTFPLPHVIRHFDNITSALSSIKRRPADLIILDLHLPDSRGLDTFRTTYAAAPETPIVILSSDDSEETALDAIRLGAEDYLVKGANDRLTLIRSLRFALERKRRLEAEGQIDAARIIQQALLPTEDPEIEDYDIAGAMIPASQTAGGYYDFIVPMPAIGDQTAGLIVADASGHGYGAAMLMAETRGCIHALVRTETDPARILELTHDVLQSNRHTRFITMFLGCLDRESSSFVYASAGQEGFLLRADGSTEALTPSGLPLGIGADIPWKSIGPLDLASGDLLVIATDGIAEARNPDEEFYGKERFIELLQDNRSKSSSQLIETVMEDLRDFCGEAPRKDDMTIVIVKPRS